MSERLTPDEYAALEIAREFLGRIQEPPEHETRITKLSRSLISLHNKLEAAEHGYEGQFKAEAISLSGKVLDLRTELASAHAAYQRLCDSLEVTGRERDEARGVLRTISQVAGYRRLSEPELRARIITLAMAQIAAPEGGIQNA